MSALDKRGFGGEKWFERNAELCVGRDVISVWIPGTGHPPVMSCLLPLGGRGRSCVICSGLSVYMRRGLIARLSSVKMRCIGLPMMFAVARCIVWPGMDVGVLW